MNRGYKFNRVLTVLPPWSPLSLLSTRISSGRRSRTERERRLREDHIVLLIYCIRTSTSDIPWGFSRPRFYFGLFLVQKIFFHIIIQAHTHTHTHNTKILFTLGVPNLMTKREVQIDFNQKFLDTLHKKTHRHSEDSSRSFR